jgi:lysozyme family protein
MAINDGRFLFAVDYVLRNEGWDKFTFDPDDPGGATKWGVTLATLKRFRKDDNLDAMDVAALTKSDALQIYYELYWQGKFDGITNKRLAAKLMDVYVNLPGKAAVRIMQRACNRIDYQKISVDGVWGPQTQGRIIAQNHAQYLEQLVYLLEDYYQAVTAARRASGKYKNPDKYLKGWLARARRLPSNSYIQES